MCMTQPKGLYRRHSPSPLAALLWGRKYSNWTSRARWTQPETEGNVGRWARWCFVFKIFNWTSFTWGPLNSQLIHSLIPWWETLEVYWNFHWQRESAIVQRKVSIGYVSYWRQNFTHSGRALVSRTCQAWMRRRGEGREGCPRKEFNFCLSFATQIFLSLRRSFFIGWGKATAHVMVTGVAISFAVVVAYIN